jgi:hypothetical protein
MSEHFTRDVRRLKLEIEAIRQSPAYELGCLISQIRSSPVKHGLAFPFKVLGLLLNRRRKQYKKCQNQSANSWRKKRKYINPDLETHSYPVFPPAKPVSSESASGLRLGLICSPRLYACMQTQAVCSLVPDRDWEKYLQNAQPGIVLIESALDTVNGQWASNLTSPEGMEAFQNFVQLCRDKGIPVVFWHTMDSVNAGLFMPAAGVCDRIYAVDQNGCDTFQAACPNVPCGVLPVAVAPQLHNPFKPGSRINEFQGFSFLFDGWNDLLEYPRELSQMVGTLRSDGLHVTDSVWRFMARKLDDLPQWRKHIKGCLGYEEFVTALKAYPVLLLPGWTLSSQSARARKALEALCCGAGVVADDSLELPQGLDVPESALVRAADDEFAPQARRLLKKEQSRRKGVHLARRAIFSAHTYGHRLNTIQQDLGLAPSWNDQPLICAVMPTKRPENIRHGLEMFQAQGYQPKELIIVLNKSDAKAEDKIRCLIAGLENVKLMVLHQEMNIGSCLNTAIQSSQARLWFKMDDDDFYGFHYLTDLVQAWHCTNADILGKTAGYVYLQAEDAVYMRKHAQHSQIICDSPFPHMCGATISGQKKTIDRVSFAMDERSCVDSNFFFNSLQAGLRVCLADPLNFVVFRSADKGDHTWRFSDQQIRNESIKISEGMDFSQVMI